MFAWIAPHQSSRSDSDPNSFFYQTGGYRPAATNTSDTTGLIPSRYSYSTRGTIPYPGLKETRYTL